MALNVSDFAKKIKNKYPEYKDVDDLELAKKIVEKYPEYKSRVIFDDSVKKKEQSIPASTPTSIVSKEVPKPLQESGTTTNSQVDAVDNYIENADGKLPTDGGFMANVGTTLSNEKISKPRQDLIEVTQEQKDLEEAEKLKRIDKDKKRVYTALDYLSSDKEASKKKLYSMDDDELQSIKDDLIDRLKLSPEAIDEAIAERKQQFKKERDVLIVNDAKKKTKEDLINKAINKSVDLEKYEPQIFRRDAKPDITQPLGFTPKKTTILSKLNEEDKKKVIQEAEKEYNANIDIKAYSLLSEDDKNIAKNNAEFQSVSEQLKDVLSNKDGIDEKKSIELKEKLVELEMQRKELGARERLYNPFTGQTIDRDKATPEIVEFNNTVQQMKKSLTDKDITKKVLEDNLIKLEYFQNKLDEKIPNYQNITYRDLLNPATTMKYQFIDEATEKEAFKLRDEFLDAGAKAQALSSAIYTNQDPAAIKRGLFKESGGSDAFGRGLSDAIGLRNRLTDLDEAEIATKFTEAMQEAEENNVLTKAQIENAKETFGEKLTYGAGASLPVMAEIMASTMLLESGAGALGVARGLVKMRGLIETIVKSKKASNLFTNIIKEGAKGVITFAPTSETGLTGSVEGVTQALLPQNMFKGNKYGKLMELGTRILAGTATETPAELAGMYVQSASDNGWDMEAAFDRTFGRTPKEIWETLAMTTATSAMMSGAFNSPILLSSKKGLEQEVAKGNVPKEDLEAVQEIITLADEKLRSDNPKVVTIKSEGKESIVPTEDFEATLQDEVFIEKVANGDIDVSIDNDTELGNRLNEKVEEFKTKQEYFKELEDDSENEAGLPSDEQGQEDKQVETTKTNIDETESTGTTETTEDDTKSNTRLDDAPTGKEESIPEIERKEKQTGIRTSRLPITDIEVRPDVFQFKAVDEESGVNKAEKLEGSYDENLAGTIGVWVDTKGEVGDVGKTYVVDGHHRMEFAKRNNIDEMNVFYIDAPTANDAKVIAAKANIAQGRGTAIDAAKVFKASPESETKSFIPKSKVGRDGLALSNLSEPLFNLVVNGKLGVDRGVLLSQGKDATVQEAVYNEIKKVEGSGAIKMKNSTIKEYIDAGNSSNKTTETTVDLFGETEQEKVDISTRMNLLGTIRDKLISAKNIFGQAARNSDVLNKVGNKVNEEMNAGLSKDAAENIALFDAFKNTTILSKTINNAVDKYKEAKTRKEKTDITEKLYNDIIGIVTKEVGKESTTESKTAAEETKRERIDREIKETVNKMKGKLGSGGLQNIEEFVKLVSLYVEKGILNVQELIDRIRKDFPNEPLNTKMVDDALAIINAEKNIKQAIKNKKPKLDALNDAFNDYQANGGTLSLTDFIKGLTSHTREQKKIKEQAKVEERKAETETILESKPKTKEDKIKKVALKLGLKTQQDLNKEVADLIKEYMVKGLLNDRQVKALTKRALGVKVGNLKSQTDFANFFYKVMDDVEYVNRLDRLNALDDLKRKVAKNVKKKIGFVSEKVNTILRLKDVPDNLIDEYESVLRNLGARETIIEVDMEALDKLHEKVLKELEVKDNSLSNEEELSDEQLEQLKELDKEIEEAKKQEAIEQYIELSEYVDVNEFDFNNDKVTRAAIQFASLPKAFLETLSSKQVVNIAKELVNLNNGFISNGLVVNTVLNYNGWVEAQNVLDSKNILNRKGTEDKFQEQTKELESELKKEKKAAIKKGEKIAKKIEKKVADRMQQHIDSLIGGIKNTSIYEAIVSKVSSAEGAISDNNMREEANISKLLKAAVVSKIGNIKYRLGKTTKATYRLNTVIEFVLRQQEHLANPDNKKTPSLQELFNKMNEAKEKQADGSLGSDDFDIVEEVYNNISKYEKDGVIDIQSFIDNELTKEEQSLIEYIKDGYKRYEEKYVYLENMRGRTPEMTSEYSHRSSSMNDTDISSEEDAYKKMLGGGFKSGSVEKRIATVPLIKPLGISNFLSYINDVNTDFYLSPVVKELNSTFKHLKAEGNETTNSVAKTLQDLTKKNLKSTFIKQQVATINQKIWRTLVGNVAKKTLIALQRIPQETTNLLVFLPKIPKLIKNAKVNKEIRESGALDIIMEEYGTSQNERLNMIGRGTATADIKQMDMAKTLRKGLKTTNVSGKEKALDLLRNNILADIGEASMKAYYQFVDVALPYSFTTEFSSKFKAITGKDFDSQAFVNDKVYRAKNEIHIRRAIAQAQKDTSDLYNTASRFEGKIEGKDKPSSVKAMLSNFMQSFSFNEQSTLVSAGKSIFGKGSMSASEGWVKFMALTLRSILYDVIGKAVVNGIINALVDDEDEEVLNQDKMIKQAGGNYLMLALMGNLPAYQKVLLGTALNYTQEAYSKYYKKEEFDKDDQLFIGFNSTRGRDVMRMFGASGAILIMADDILSKAIKLQEKAMKGEEITDKDIYELKVMVSLYDMVSVATGIPLYRDVKLLHKKLEAEQGVYQKFGAKKTGKYKKKVIKPISD